MLPIEEIREAMLSSLKEANRLVLTAPTGSGKTTQVPQFLYRSGMIQGQIIVLQPRRLAARMVAQRVASEMETPLGGLVGYQTRHDSKVGPGTVIRFMTEGLFLRMLGSNPRLGGIGAVVLDEFHERNLATDVAIALVKRLQESSREDLRLIVMSATLDAQRVGEYLQCPVLEAHGRTHPVEISYLARRPVASPVAGRFQTRAAIAPWELAADALREIVQNGDNGDVLIFMPGAYEIRRTIEACGAMAGDGQMFPLYSELPAREQDAAMAPANGRKVIVSTNVAETSITIPGIRHVIDSGLARINRFDPRRGINVLEVEPISLASADQRSGRAGRTAPGTCRRLWVEADNKGRPRHPTPEVRRLELSEVVLQILSFGVQDLERFAWLEPPEPLALEQAIQTLRLIGAVGPDGHPTAIGQRLAGLPMHPRLGRMLLEAQKRRCVNRAALWAAIISERDILIRGQTNPFAQEIPTGFPMSDFLALEGAFEFAQGVHFDPTRCASKGVHGPACRELAKTRQLYLDALDAPRQDHDNGIEALAKSLLPAFADHVAIRRNDKNLAAAIVGGRRGELDPQTVARHAGPLLPLEIREIASAGSVRTILSLVTELDEAWIDQVLPGSVTNTTVTIYNAQTMAVEAVQQRSFKELILDEKPLPDPQVDKSLAAQLLAEQVVSGALKLERWDDSVEQWIERTRCVAQWFPEKRLLTYEPDEIRLIIEEICAGATRFKGIKERPCLQAVKDAMPYEDQRLVEQMAPERLALPRGWRMKIEYSAGAAPRGRAKIQDFYGLTETPRVGGGRIKLLLELLAPNMRPVQTTDDLANFWRTLYPTIKKELSRRYPRHEWK